MAINYQKKNLLYQPEKNKRKVALDLYNGGRRVEKNMQYLIRHPFESDKQYDIRLARATYRNFAAPIVDIFCSFVCDKRPERVLPTVLEPMLVNADRMQTNADTFFNNIVQLASAGGVRFVLVDMEAARGQTIAEDRAAGRYAMPYFVDIDADDVWDWAVDEDGISWVAIHSVKVIEDKPFEDIMVQDVVTVWDRQGWHRYTGAIRVISQAMNIETAAMELDSEGVHGFGEVPVVPFLFEPTTAMTGNPVTDDVLTLIERVYRRDSELDKMLFDCAVPLAIFNGLDQKAMNDFIRSSSSVLISSDPQGINGQYIEPSGSSYNALKEAIANDVNSIREIALRMVRPMSAVGESAESKSIDKQQLDTQLAQFARRCENAERKCWDYAYRWLNNGSAPADGEIETKYNEDYTVNQIEKLDRAYLLEMYRSGVISKQTYFEMMKDIGTLPTDFNAEEELRRIESDMKSGIGPSGTNKATGNLKDVLGF